MVQDGMERKLLCLKGAEADVIGVSVTVKRVLFWLTTKGKWLLCTTLALTILETCVLQAKRIYC